MRERRHRIAHIMPWPTVGGTEQATLRIAEAVRPYGFESVAFCFGERAPVHEIFAAAGFETVSYHPVEHSYRRVWPFLRYSWRLAREFKRRRVDLIHCADLLAGYHAALAGRMAGLPVLCHIRCCYDQLSRRDRSFLWPINRFIFVSRDTWRRFAHKVSEKRGVVIYDGIEADRVVDANAARDVRREFGVPDEAKIVGMVARVAPAKDYATLARAAARVVAVYPQVRFLIVGDHSERAEYREHYREVKEMLRANRVEDLFIFAGFRSDVARLLDAMDVFALSTHTEGLPLVVLEAMAHGKPVVATAVGGVPEAVVDGETGLLYGHGDDEGLATHLLVLLQDEEKARSFGANGRRIVRERWNRERFAADMARVYREALGLTGLAEVSSGQLAEFRGI
ncbi:glycosyltransferase [Pyrinomonas sp.]|uniref:glycosyltransferase n=1 Tax=Pyrinomonas sp. TaxID=2080306 RepID=UPI00332F8FA5